MQPILSDDLLEIRSVSATIECTHIINSPEYLQKEVCNLMKHGKLLELSIQPFK